MSRHYIACRCCGANWPADMMAGKEPLCGHCQKYSQGKQQELRELIRALLPYLCDGELCLVCGQEVTGSSPLEHDEDCEWQQAVQETA